MLQATTKMNLYCETLSQSLQTHTHTKNPVKEIEKGKAREKQARKKEFITPQITSITELYGVLRDNTCFQLYRMKLVKKV